MARPEGLEPPAYRFEACRSIQLSYGRAQSSSLVDASTIGKDGCANITISLPSHASTHGPIAQLAEHPYSQTRFANFSGWLIPPQIEGRASKVRRSMPPLSGRRGRGVNPEFIVTLWRVAILLILLGITTVLTEARIGPSPQSVVGYTDERMRS